MKGAVRSERPGAGGAADARPPRGARRGRRVDRGLGPCVAVLAVAFLPAVQTLHGHDAGRLPAPPAPLAFGRAPARGGTARCRRRVRVGLRQRGRLPTGVFARVRLQPGRLRGRAGAHRAVHPLRREVRGAAPRARARFGGGGARRVGAGGGEAGAARGAEAQRAGVRLLLVRRGGGQRGVGPDHEHGTAGRRAGEPVVAAAPSPGRHVRLRAGRGDARRISTAPCRTVST